MVFRTTVVIMDGIDFVLCSIGIPANFLLILAIIFSKESNLKAYSLILFHSAVTDLIEVIVELMAMTRMISQFPYLVYIFEGFCTHFGTFACQLSLQMELHLMFHSILLIAVSFWYRNSVLSGRNPSFLNTQLVISAILVPTILSTSIFAWTDDSQRILPQIYPGINLTGVAHASCNLSKTRMIIIGIWTSVAPTVAYCFIFYYRREVNRKMCEQTNRMSTRTREMNASLIKALFYHALIPSVTSLGMIGFIAQNFGLQNAVIERATFMVCTIPPAINPLLTLYFIGPYRRFITRFLWKQKGQSTITTSIGPSNRSASDGPRS